MTNMGYRLQYCMSAWYIFVTNCMSDMDIAGFCACLRCTSLCFQTTYFRGLLQCSTPVVYWLIPLHRDLEVPSSIPIHVCDFLYWFCLDLYDTLLNNSAGVWKKNHNDAKKKKTEHYQIACWLVHLACPKVICMSTWYHTSMSGCQTMSEIWWFIIACSTCIQDILHVHKATFFQIACPFCKVHVSKLQLCKLHVQHAIWKWIACSRAELFSDAATL